MTIPEAIDQLQKRLDHHAHVLEFIIGKRIDEHEACLERLCIEAAGHEDYDSLVKRVDQHEAAIQHLAEIADVAL
jgi:hypothetical protein